MSASTLWSKDIGDEELVEITLIAEHGERMRAISTMSEDELQENHFNEIKAIMSYIAQPTMLPEQWPAISRRMEYLAALKAEINRRERLEKRVCNNLFWSPMGQFIVLADLRANGILEFVDTNDFTVMNTTDHFQVTDVEWDPTGRYVVTAVSYWKVKVDTGYWIWSFQGKIIKRNNVDGFCNFLWRPRPPTLLTVEQQKEIRKNLKKFSPQFESKDRMRMTKASKELMEKRRQLMKDFEEIRNRQMEVWKSQKARRLELRYNVDTDELDSDTKNVEEEVVEFFVKEEITVVE